MLTPAATVIEKVALAVLPTESVAVMLKLGVPVVVGLPLSTPAVERLSPAGKVEPLVTAQV
jgi:hypothetical protein